MQNGNKRRREKREREIDKVKNSIVKASKTLRNVN